MSIDFSFVYSSTPPAERYHFVVRVRYLLFIIDKLFSYPVSMRFENNFLFSIHGKSCCLEGYPLMFPSMYNNKAAFYINVYIFTNWALHEQYKNVQSQYPSTWATYLRRIKTVYDFDKSK